MVGTLTRLGTLLERQPSPHSPGVEGRDAVGASCTRVPSLGAGR
jgi:hypothetical protein